MDQVNNSLTSHGSESLTSQVAKCQVRVEIWIDITLPLNQWDKANSWMFNHGEIGPWTSAGYVDLVEWYMLDHNGHLRRSYAKRIIPVSIPLEIVKNLQQAVAHMAKDKSIRAKEREEWKQIREDLDLAVMRGDSLSSPGRSS